MQMFLGVIFTHLTVVDRDSETQLQVGENLIELNLLLNLTKKWNTLQKDIYWLIDFLF